MHHPSSISFWEQQSFFNYDFIVVGAGIVGLSSAIELKEQYPSSSVLVLEKGFIPTGASTKNAGFACFGSATEIEDDLHTMSQQDALELVKLRWEGLGILRNRLGDKAMDYKSYGGYELITDKETYILDKLPYLNAFLKEIFSDKVFNLKDKQISNFGFVTKHLIENKYEGQIDTGKMMRALLDLTLKKGVEVKTNAEVTSFVDNTSGVCIQVNNKYELNAGKIIICTNAFTKSLLPSTTLTPGRGQVLITKPIKQLTFKGVFHFDKGYFYFRNYQNRVLFGGGRNYFLNQEATTDFETTANVRQLLEEKLQAIILPNQSYEIEHSWSGIMAFGKNKQPILKAISDNVIIAVRLGGMGVAIGSRLAQLAVQKLKH